MHVRSVEIIEATKTFRRKTFFGEVIISSFSIRFNDQTFGKDIKTIDINLTTKRHQGTGRTASMLFVVVPVAVLVFGNWASQMKLLLLGWAALLRFLRVAGFDSLQ